MLPFIPWIRMFAYFPARMASRVMLRVYECTSGSAMFDWPVHVHSNPSNSESNGQRWDSHKQCQCETRRTNNEIKWLVTDANVRRDSRTQCNKVVADARIKGPARQKQG
jgi:hypothetical protein